MWEDPDPGGTNIKGTSPQELSELKDQNEQQLLLIAQLKEMLRKDQSTVSQDKVEEYVNTLNRARAKRSKQKRSDSSSSSSTTTSSANIDANKKERVNLLRQQLEVNKARLAERDKSQRGIEEMVTQLQAQLKDAQLSGTSTPLNLSLVETKSLDYNESTPQKELYNILLTKEKKMTELLNKSQKLEGVVLDLQENLKEKDSVIDARTKAITLMTDSLSKKGKNTLDALEETKDQMRKMQENFVTLEAEMKARQLILLNDLKVKNFEIGELQDLNGQLERDKLMLEQQLAERVLTHVEAAQSPDIEILRKEMEQLQLNNKTLLEKYNKPYDELQNSYEDICWQNDVNMAKISELKGQLEEALLSDRNQGQSLARSDEENQRLIEENRKITEKNFELEAKLVQLEKQLEELSLNANNNEENKILIEENQRLSRENDDNLSRIVELQKQLEDSQTDLKLLKNTGMGGSTKSTKEANEENAKLKKQLEESNKSMIKMRAVQKGKIKELNKRLDQFKKMGDANVLIAQLQNEIGKLNEKIAELEDEKGNFQLKMVDSTSSSKEDSTEFEEEINLLKDQLAKTKDELGEKDKVVQLLESEVLALKADLKQKNEEEIKVSSQVSSEMSSICYEEQIEALELEKERLIDQLKTIEDEKEHLLQELEMVGKEKLDLNAKLESYIQENMDLIDKLEKLSAEKVSSAESIEIVEGLTQQEKLELAAYQKHINPEETLKCPEDDAIEPPAELNESVLQLSEDTAELLQKIEMFTQERKEVMQKMEAMKEDNNMLILKVNEIENNRSILEETYEQLQNDKDALLNEKQELSNKLDKMQQREILQKDEELSANVLAVELKNLQIKYEALIQENDELKRTLKEFDAVVQEKYDLEARLRETVENNTSLDTKLNSNLDEINAYQLTIEDNKVELVDSAETINRLHKQIEERENDIKELHINISELNSVIGELQGKQTNFEVMESELESLKSTLTNQITQASDYESELAQNSDTIKKLNEELLGMNRRTLELENELELKENEIEKITKEVKNKDEIIKKLQSDIEDKDRSFKVLTEDIKGKYLRLKEQQDSNDESLRKEISKLTNKNQEQLEKMKKIAANLKKKNQAYQELEELYTNEKHNWETSEKEKDGSIETLKRDVISVTQALEDTRNENESIINQIKILKEEIQILEQNNAEQQHYIQDLKHKQEKLQETSLQQEMSASLHEEIDPTFSRNVPDDKIRELELLLETNESDLSHYKERVTKLEEDVRTLQEAKSRLEAVNAELGEKLDLTSHSFKEKALLEDQLELRLAEVSANDEVLSKKLQESQSEREELLKKSQENEILIKRLKIKLKKAHDRVTELQSAQTNLQDLETTNQELKRQVASLEDNQRHIQNENESLQRRNMSDYEKIEADYQAQLEELLRTKNELTTDNEKLSDKVKELAELEQELNWQLNEYKTRLDQIEATHTEEVKVLRNEIERETAERQKLATELNQADWKLQESSAQINSLKQELDSANGQIIDVQNQLGTLMLENNNIVSSLEISNEKYTSQSIEVRQAIDALEVSAKKVHQLNEENEKLKQEVQALEFAKSSLEASYESTQKLDNAPIVEGLPENAPSLQWPDQSDQKQSEKINLLLQDVNEKFERSVSEAEALKLELNVSKQELQSTSDEAGGLRAEIDKLKDEIRALQFAKSSLEASYESSQRPPADTSQNMEVLEEIPPIVAKAEQPQQTVPLFNAFAQPTTQGSSAFDLFGATKDWFSQTSENSLNQASSKQETTSEDWLSAEATSGESWFGPATISSQARQPQQSLSPVVEDGREALLKKIKALEFLLYNTDKEKEIALEQCTEMVNELAQVIYNRTSAPQSREFSSDLESQIMSQEAIDNLPSNKGAEYVPINPNYGEQSTPVVEEVIEPKKAYLCFDDDDPPKEDKKMPIALESQVVSEKDIAEASTSKKALQALEYEKVVPILGEQQQPVVEPLAQPKHAYLCYTKDDKPQSLEAFEENDDGWAWGPEEARLEEEHMSTLENIPQVKTLLLEIQQLKENVRVLQVERDNHLEEIRQLQIKSGKLIKKCKELKAKSDHTTADGGGGFFDLNETIQDELKAQMQQLEKKLKELTAEREKEKAEKSNLLKRVDVLTSANERMIEMKEIQDSEVLRWQRKHQEAVDKLQDGVSDGRKQITTQSNTSTSSVDQTSSKIKELEDAVKDLSLDNEELQTLLEEERTKRLEAEKNKRGASDEELTEIRTMNQTLHKELDGVRAKTGDLQSELSRVLAENDKLTHEKGSLERSVQELQNNIEALHKNEIANLKNQINNDQRLIQDRDAIIEDLQSNFELLNNRKVELDQVVAQLRNNLSQMQSSLEQNVSSNLESAELKSQVDHLNALLQERQEDIASLNDNIAQLNNKLQNNEGDVKTLTNEKEQKDLEYQTTLNELQAKIVEIQEAQAIISDLRGRIGQLEAFGTEINKKDADSQLLTEQLHIKSQKLDEKQCVVNELQLSVSENAQAIAIADEELRLQAQELRELKIEKLKSDEEIQRLLTDVRNKEQEFQQRIDATISELNNNWQVQVDQRGADVAESWKMHLEMVEKDFGSVQDKLKSDLLELEEKCNILVNENNELRRNVDQEIRNEVDKLSALHQQISNLQQSINSLNQIIGDKDKQIEEIQNNLSNYLSLESELDRVRRENEEKENKLASINIIIETTQKQFDEKREVVEAIVSMLEKKALAPISYEKEDILNEFQRQLTVGDGNDIRINQLEEKLKRLSGESTREITGLNQVIEDLHKDLSVVHEKEAEILRLSAQLDILGLQRDDIDLLKREKERLQSDFAKISQEHSNCLATIENLNKEIEQYSNAQEDKHKEIIELNQQLTDSLENVRNDSNKEIERLNSAIAQAKDEFSLLQGSLAECQAQLYETSQQLAQKTQELQGANETIAQYRQSVSYYEQENNRLMGLLDQRDKEYNDSLEVLKNNRLEDVRRHYDELLSNRDLDINVLRGQVQELVGVNQKYEERLKEESSLKRQLEEQLREQTQLVDEDTKQLEELKLIIEDQVAKIEELKKELFDKSNHYDSLIAEMDVGRPPVTRQPSASAPVNPDTQRRNYVDEDLSEPVNRAELDLALYMLHQRDVRCEELTVELTQLLEERDTLQLRLSNAIREKEELRRSLAGNNSSIPITSTDISPIKSKSSAIFLAASGTELAKDPLESEQNLATKLSELRNVGYKKDKTFVDEQEARRFQQFAIMQQHINDASRLPPEAAAKLVDASYTLSRDVQSPSKVLLNWLWGKSPPRANDS